MGQIPLSGQQCVFALFPIPAILTPNISLSCLLYEPHTIRFPILFGRNPYFISRTRHCESNTWKQHKNAFNACWLRDLVSSKIYYPQGKCLRDLFSSKISMETVYLPRSYLYTSHLHPAGCVYKKKIHNSISAMVARRKRWAGTTDLVLYKFSSEMGVPDQ